MFFNILWRLGFGFDACDFDLYTLVSAFAIERSDFFNRGYDTMPENTTLKPKINSLDMGKVYDEFADAFGKADQLPTWRFVGISAMKRILGPSLRPGVTFLDFGSASARVEAGVLLPHGVRPSDMTGVEISPDQVKMAQARIPDANFIVGDVTDPELLKDKSNTFGVVFSHMVFEHLSDDQLARACANAYRLLKPGGTFAFVVTHPDKMTHTDGSLVKTYGLFETSAPWGGGLPNWRRSVSQTVDMVQATRFKIETVEEIEFPQEVPVGLSLADIDIFNENRQKYSRYPAIRLAVVAIKPTP